MLDLAARCVMVSIEAIVLIFYLVTARRYIRGNYDEKPIS
jgi:hypothetical protein